MRRPVSNEVLDPSQGLTISQMIQSIPDAGIRKQLAIYDRDRNLADAKSWEAFAREFWFHYRLLCEIPIADKAGQQRVQMLSACLSKFVGAFREWQNTEAVQKLEEKVKLLMGDLDAFMEVTKQYVDQENYQLLMEDFRVARSKHKPV